MPQTIKDRIDKVIKRQKESLDLGSMSLTELPEQIKEITWLKRLNLSFNSLTKLPTWLKQLSNLETLDLRGNQLSELFPGLSELQNLQSINLRNNRFTILPIELRELKKLTFISVDNNVIEVIPEWFFNFKTIFIENNPITDPPIEIVNRGTQSILNYFKELEKGVESLYEAKLLIVGEGGAGKTSLMNKILNEDCYLNPYEPSTKGIEINPFYFDTHEKRQFRINIWDFGGQEIYHATHQFFLTRRSLYLLLSDNRAENTDFNYWLQVIELLSGNSPLLIVQNERDDRKKDINEAGMKDRFKNIKFSTSLNIASNKKALRSLLSEIKHQIVKLSHIGTELPKVWVSIRKELENISKNTPYISERKYLDVCEKFGMPEKDRAFFLSDYFHDLGVFLHFRDNAVLKRWIILQPDWGTEAVYKVLDNKTVIERNGYFTKHDLKEIWHDSTYVDMHDELISLMVKFELCYQLEEAESYIAPQLLTSARPKFEWQDMDNLIMRFEYEFMPKGIITRFIVRMNSYILNQKSVWREGVVLVRTDTKAEVTETYGKREIRVRVHGKNKKEFLAIIMDSLESIHRTYSNLKVTNLIPCNCKECIKSFAPHYFQYKILKKFLSGGIGEARCEQSLLLVKITPLIDDALGQYDSTNNSICSVYISYVLEDESLAKEFDKYLKPIEKPGEFKFSDRLSILPGDNERQFIRDKIDTADIIILLITQNYLTTNWSYNNELIKSIERSEVDSCTTIPVILKDCLWVDTPLNNYKPVLYNEKPLFQEPENSASALTTAAHEIKKAISAHISKKTNIQIFDDLDK
jgi:internalin A